MAESQLIDSLAALGARLHALDERTQSALAGISDPDDFLYWKLIAVMEAATDVTKAADLARQAVLDTGDFALDAERIVARVRAGLPESMRPRIGAAEPVAVPPDPGE
ncbi:hypothetical protein OHB26_39335 (plasmid) [Nocardia sp. NBC_01503]|uniref:hypothetical protein n=1 Tax=Nocardia sp. NBC_01503 TaxID=2975997 RepID=UPI002E7BD941|nr:hypothetical protein [Nocardia sp. NBC_01503]WTL36714.1 hypothetical protein OHB26_39240 [Nocardia sp. NBC_01503]WTL36733.1 hypothetical protein OHB26_39335 [Nocardia sp. NBC_01503]